MAYWSIADYIKAPEGIGGPLKFFHLFILVFLFYAPAHGQTVYKCGSTFSQTPCANDAKKIEVKPAVPIDCTDYKHTFSEACRGKSTSNGSNSVAEAKAKVQKQIDAMSPTVPPSSEVVEANKKRCLAKIVAMLKDPESARVGDVHRAPGPEPDYETARGWSPSISYTVSINAKNSFGGYTGSKTWACSFDLAEQEILRTRSFE
jgi:hypothetical protein